jgi:hypothetical protein
LGSTSPARLLFLDKILPNKRLFRADAVIEWRPIMSVEGGKEPEGLFLKVLVVTVNMLIHRASKISCIAVLWPVHKGHGA